MNKRTALAFCVFLAGCAQPLSDSAVKAAVDRCKEAGMVAYVFNGASSFVECREVKK